jgi:ABC-2 type transport system ATP-binding protein
MKLEVKNLTKSFGEKEVLHGISFDVEGGKALGLLGRNGAGKTTTIRIIMDVFHANSGEIFLDGKKERAYRSFFVLKKIVRKIYLELRA